MKTFVFVVFVLGALNTLAYMSNMADGSDLPEWTRHFDAAFMAGLAIWAAFLLGGAE